jgi:hypothetical protein
MAEEASSSKAVSEEMFLSKARDRKKEAKTVAHVKELS